MQDIQIDTVTPDQLVSEILCTASSFGSAIGMGTNRAHVDNLCGEVMSGTDIEDSNVTCPRQDVVVLDCQNPVEFHECHIRGAINVTFPAIMVRRIAAGKIDLFEKSKELKAKVGNNRMTFVVYDSYLGVGGGDGDSTSELSDLVTLVAKKLAQSGCRVATLKGGLSKFRECYPEWVESFVDMNKSRAASSSASSEDSCAGSPAVPGEVPLLGLGCLASLRIRDDPDACDSSIGLDLEDAFPVEIIPNLFLGNATISSDEAILERHNIKHVLNVTPDLPNLFENSIRYLQIPISDHWTQSMLNYFPAAIAFIDEGRSKDEGVLVHCLAGISRSVTITMAYIMCKMNMSLNEAYDLVRSRKSNISPNFHFMGQLLDFERQLHSQFLSPPALGSSPDSGIEFDRWNPN